MVALRRDLPLKCLCMYSLASFSAILIIESSRYPAVYTVTVRSSPLPWIQALTWTSVRYSQLRLLAGLGLIQRDAAKYHGRAQCSLTWSSPPPDYSTSSYSPSRDPILDHIEMRTSKPHYWWTLKLTPNGQSHRRRQTLWNGMEAKACTLDQTFTVYPDLTEANETRWRHIVRHSTHLCFLSSWLNYQSYSLSLICILVCDEPHILFVRLVYIVYHILLAFEPVSIARI